MPVRTFPSLLAAAALALASQPAVAAPNDSAAKTLAEAKPTIDKANAEWLPAMRAKDPAALAAAYAEDGAFILADGREISGRAAIIDFYRQQVANLGEVLEGGIHQDGMTLALDGLIYEWGHGGATIADKAGKRSTSGGPYLTVWKRQADGRWMILRNLVF